MNRIIKRLGIVLFLAAALGLALVPGCGLFQSESQRDLNAARAKREKSGIDDYEYHLRILCFCPPNVTFPVIIKVENGINLSVEYAQEPKEVTNDYFKPVDTIDKLFDVIQKAIDNEADSLVVEYDSTYGYPKSIAIDPIKNAIDEETPTSSKHSSPVRL
jgi:hypothetical protein